MKECTLLLGGRVSGVSSKISARQGTWVEVPKEDHEDSSIAKLHRQDLQAGLWVDEKRSFKKPLEDI